MTSDTPPAPDPRIEPGARLLIVGGSTVAGLGVHGRSFAHLVAEQLQDGSVLDLGRSGRTLDELRPLARQIREFRPDVAIICAGSSESMVHPGPLANSMIERFAPPTWHGVSGLQARPYYSTDPIRRRKQRATSLAKVVIKNIVIRVTRGRPRMDPDRFGVELRHLLSSLVELGCTPIVLDLWRTDGRLFPRTNQALARASAVLRQVTDDVAPGSLVSVRDELRCWEDFQEDRFHWNEAGHRRMADRVLDRLAVLRPSDRRSPTASPA